MSGVLTILVVFGEELLPTDRELLSEGRRLADASGGPLTAVLLGKDFAGVTRGLDAYGANRVLTAELDSPLPASPLWLLGQAEQVARQAEPQVVLLTHASPARELAVQLAFRLRTGVVTDATGLRVDGGSVVATKPIFGGSALTDLAVTATPAVITLRPRAFQEAEARPSAGQAEVDVLPAIPNDPRVEMLEQVTEQTSEGPQLKDATIVVAGGRGLGAPENWRYIEELAQVLGGAVGASRAVTDAGWISTAHQVGLTGASIAPDLYITVGISGAVQHIAGITGARNVVAINRDPDANIFKYARWGVVGDWKEIVPALTERARQLRS